LVKFLVKLSLTFSHCSFDQSVKCGHTSKQTSKQTIYVCKTLLYEKENINSVSSQATTSIENKKTSQCICDLIRINKENEYYQSKSFVNIFVSNLLKNMKQANNNFQFDPIVTKFASVFNILAGHNAYEFIRINLPGALPTTTTLKNYNQTANLRSN
jgi:hypothetical protein